MSQRHPHGDGTAASLRGACALPPTPVVRLVTATRILLELRVGYEKTLCSARRRQWRQRSPANGTCRLLRGRRQGRHRLYRCPNGHTFERFQSMTAPAPEKMRPRAAPRSLHAASRARPRRRCPARGLRLTPPRVSGVTASQMCSRCAWLPRNAVHGSASGTGVSRTRHWRRGPSMRRRPSDARRSSAPSRSATSRRPPTSQ